MCSGHSKEHFKTNLTEYWGGGGVHGRSSYLPDYRLGPSGCNQPPFYYANRGRLSPHWRSLAEQFHWKTKQFSFTQVNEQKGCVMNDTFDDFDDKKTYS